MTTDTIASSSDVSLKAPQQEDLIQTGKFKDHQYQDTSNDDSASNDGERLLLDNFSEGDGTSDQDVNAPDNELKLHNLVNMRMSANESEIDSEKGYVGSSGAL